LEKQQQNGAHTHQQINNECFQNRKLSSAKYFVINKGKENEDQDICKDHMVEKPCVHHETASPPKNLIQGLLP
jgi:hypothetical protein